jgi:hypothetical protein
MVRFTNRSDLQSCSVYYILVFFFRNWCVEILVQSSVFFSFEKHEKSFHSSNKPIKKRGLKRSSSDKNVAEYLRFPIK